ncbi:MAG TPA: D-alanyl-D-alanine carboxypeptidase, partial [Tabrizicola sp.]|nr:D-alanyl-D-alanine carboxypeptidase [Tabrizicola sp.]
MISRRMMLAGLLAGAAFPAVAEVMDSSPRPMARGGKAVARVPQGPLDASDLVAAAKLGAASVAYVLLDARTGAMLEARDPDLPLPPASVAKAVTSLFALEKLGAGYRFATRVLATGPVSGGMVQGDIVLAGGGDPTLQTDQLGDLVVRLAKAGLKGATGRFLYWDGALPQLDQIAADQPV